MTMITVVLYNPSWQIMFEEEAARIKQALGDNCLDIHHIGSTSVPGLAAKPIIDILPVVKDIRNVDIADSKMIEMGYESKGEGGVVFRRYFVKTKPIRTHNVHIFEEGNPEIERHLLFRDYLRAHPEACHYYSELKKELAKQYPNDINTYCLGKEQFIQNIIDKQGFNGFRVMQALTEEEWGVVKQLGQSYIDKDEGNYHFVLRKGSKIIGYAHIKIMPDATATLRFIVIEKSCQNQGIGSFFLRLLERWLCYKDIKKLYIHTQENTYGLFEKANYKRDGDNGYYDAYSLLKDSN